MRNKFYETGSKEHSGPVFLLFGQSIELNFGGIFSLRQISLLDFDQPFSDGAHR
ncbi:hypothetical protein HMPREF9439_01622 [Parasutterella excrementihominis YIT 11859]|uniref:Uncharacterized protein n=1 Tax=Parasutterella excrementihominis YIT 11859 TaxID=762966 RepID=F3QL05_9BURK|nr:hypothetical protein HMPREF0189_02292 [Burkholderiales bacterium 1_1_47]EGG53987.1 hypothetical protein HMPREF9439_01622 [Parasutterella excrementihominis YIT 11859]